MDAKEAIEYAKKAKVLHIERYGDDKKISFYSTIIEALEKQIAKEVTNKFTDLDEEGFEVIFGGCPNCKMEVNFDDNEYCPYCGQRLDWE